MTKIFLVRHTETVGNVEKRLTGRKDYELTDRGVLLVRKLTNELQSVKFDRVYSSPSGRAIKTVEPLANLNDVDIQIDENLSEMYFGIYDGMKWEVVNVINPMIKAQQIEINEIFGIPEQESMEDVADRMYDAMKRIVDDNVDKTVLVASHGVAIEAFLRRIVGLKFTYEREKFCQYNVAINELEYDEGMFKIIRLADVKYLKEV